MIPKHLKKLLVTLIKTNIILNLEKKPPLKEVFCRKIRPQNPTQVIENKITLCYS